jgi:hypothetical protein
VVGYKFLFASLNAVCPFSVSFNTVAVIRHYNELILFKYFSNYILLKYLRGYKIMLIFNIFVTPPEII